MKICETFTRKDLVERFKAIEIVPQPWPYSSTTIQQISKRETTPTGKVLYVVQFKDGQSAKIQAQKLNDSHKQLVEAFELNRFRRREGVSSRRSSRPARSTRTSSSPSTTAVNTPLKRVAPFVTKYTNRKKIKYSAKGNNEMKDLIVSSSDESDEIEEEITTSTRSGRKLTQSKSYVNEYQSDVQFSGSSSKKGLERYQYYVSTYTDNEFIDKHSKYCMKCGQTGNCRGPEQVVIGEKVPRTRLLLCKSCSYSIHNNCLPNNPHIHFDNETSEFSCVKCTRQKNSYCVECNKSLVTSAAINNITSFRCNTCFRGFHNTCIKKGVSPELKDVMAKQDIETMYQNGQCVECFTHGATYGILISGAIIAERTAVNDSDKVEFLIKWKNQSYRHTNWVLESWMENAQKSAYRAYMKKREADNFVRQATFPIEWTIVDRILDVEWDDKDRTQVKRILAVYKDRSYDEAIWDDPPTKNDTEEYPDYKLALDRYIQASKVKPPHRVKHLIAEVRRVAKTEGYGKHELKAQPDFIKGGKLMKHQLEALNWLLYQWENNQSCILADDMGLGKTIQIISYFSVLFQKYKIFPFICVVPNSTATNWIREFQKWAPEMTVVPFFGSATSRKLALDNEIFDVKGNIKCHVVIATYESSMEFSRLHRVPWAVMVVDESQRLKNDESLLFRTLKTFDVDQKTLLTGTPLQNDLRELFNIMNFIQPKEFHGTEAKDYIDMTTANVEELHNRLRPHLLRRTKEEVLKTLPPKYELIVPLSMTPLQKRVYKECLSGEIHETLQAATGAKRQKGLSSIFVNLRKTLNHPYLLDGVETVQPTAADTQNAMINACGKLKMFHQMYPKLKAQDHRMLIFSTMTRVLDVLEDYLTYEQIRYVRLDGNCSERDRVRSIDAFNAGDSEIDVFLLSTRAGGVGINMATADTIIIWDSDFNPYADLQAISRAHRIGQTNMVLILRLMTRLTVEEKVLQIGKRKMALEHVVVEMLKETEEETYDDIESILKYGAEALFADDDSKDIHYDSAAIDSLLDREKYREAAIEKQQEEIKEAEEGNKKAAEQGLNFSFAKVWKADGSVEDLAAEDDAAPVSAHDEDFWEKFLKEKEIEAARKKEEKRLAVEQLGRGARKRAVVTYRENFNALRKGEEKGDELFKIEDAAAQSSEDELETDVVKDDGVFLPLTSQQVVQGTPKLRLNGPKETVVATGEHFQILLEHPHNFQNQAALQQAQPLQENLPQQQNQQIVLQNQQQQQPLGPAYEEGLYRDMLNFANPYMQRIRFVATKAFNENRHETVGFNSILRGLFQELFMKLDDHLKRQFLAQYSRGQANGISQVNLDAIHRKQLDLVSNHYSRLSAFFDSEVRNHFGQLNHARQEAFRQQEANRLAELKAQEEKRKDALLVEQRRQQYEAYQQRQEQLRLQVEAQARQQTHIQAQQQRQQSPIQLRPANIPTPPPVAPQSSSTAVINPASQQFPANVFSQLQSYMAQAHAQGQMSQKDFFEQLGRLSFQAAENERRKEEAAAAAAAAAAEEQKRKVEAEAERQRLAFFEEEERRKREQAEKCNREAEEKHQRDLVIQEALRQRESSNQGLSITHGSGQQQSPLSYINNHTPSPYQPPAPPQQQQQEQSSSSQSSQPYVDPTHLSRNNAKYFSNISPQVQKTLFNAAPPPPDPAAVDIFENASSSSPTPTPPQQQQPLEFVGEPNPECNDLYENAFKNIFRNGMEQIAKSFPFNKK